MNTPIDSATLDSVARLFAKRHARGAAPSCVWGVFDRRGLMRAGSTGKLSDGTTPGADTAYRIASCTKSFTAAAILSLRDAGVLGLDDPITRFVPAFAAVELPTPDAPTPTLRMLLTMSAGFPTDNPWGDRQESMTATELDALLTSGLSFDTAPGTGFAYSNLGFALLGRVIEQATGRPYIDFIHERFIEPLGLTATAFDSSVTADGGVAIGSQWVDNRWQELPFSGPGAFSAIGGLFSTVADIARWAIWLAEAFDPAASDTADSPLSLASRRELQQLQRFAPELGEHPGGYGLGLFVEHYPHRETVTSHSGGYPGFSAHMRWSQGTGLGVLAFENATGSRVSIAVTEAFDQLVKADRAAKRHGRKPDVWPVTRAIQTDVTALIRNWTDEAAERLCSENVALDEPFARRRAAIDRAITSIGGLDENASADQEEKSVFPSQLVWYLPGQAGRLRIEIQLTPEQPPRVQTLKVEADRV